MSEHPTIAMVMISNFGRADGGRETWAYQFLPRLLDRYPALRLRIFGLRVDGEADSSGDLRERIGNTAGQRVTLRFFRAGRNRIPNMLYMILAMARHVRRGDDHPPGITLCVGSLIEYLCALASPQLRRAPKVVWLRSIFVDEKAARIAPWLRPLLRTIETAILRRADLLIANGDDTAAYYRARGLTIEVIKNAVDLDKWRIPLPAFDAPVKVAFIGRLAPIKGLNEYLALAKALRQSPGDACRFEFHLFGDGDPPERELVYHAAAASEVSYHGAIDNDRLPAALCEIDVCVAFTFVRVTGTEQSGGAGVSNALLEQIAAGRLIVCWDNAAFRQVLDDDQCYFVPQGDGTALLEVFEQISNDPHEAWQRAHRAAGLADQYSFPAHLDKFAALVKQLSPQLFIPKARNV